MNIAIDGPAGAGKSTIAKLVAAKLKSVYVDTGAMYRAMALFLLKKGIAPEDADSITSVCDEADITIVYQDGVQHVILNGEDVTGGLRTEKVGNMASKSSGNKAVREKLVKLQQKLASETSVVMDGRDIGTVVLPDAEVKIFLTASAKVRAERRHQELLQRASAEEKSLVPSVETIERDIEERDYRDSHRAESPLKQADDAVLVDSSYMSIEEVASEILKIAGEKSEG
ncbi:MAG: (d)CMP kinase [Lachnospiraceae bacterium]|nr:(d)CMP kinase [Lachnospiraceae bacterium]